MRVLIVTFWHYWFHVFALSCLTRLLQQENLWRHIFCDNCVSCFFSTMVTGGQLERGRDVCFSVLCVTDFIMLLQVFTH